MVVLKKNDIKKSKYERGIRITNNCTTLCSVPSYILSLSILLALGPRKGWTENLPFAPSPPRMA